MLHSTLSRSVLGSAGALLFTLLVFAGCDNATPLDPNPSGALTGQVLSDEEMLEPSILERTILNEQPLAASLAAAELGSAFSQRANGAVFMLSNASSGNAVLAFSRDETGALTPAGMFETGGLGSDDGLGGTSNPLILNEHSTRLYAINGGSDELSAFSVNHTNLELIETIPSGGLRPVSVTVTGSLVYVLNNGRDGTPGNVSGFMVEPDGHLAPIAGATQPLAEGAAESPQIGLTPDAQTLVVTDKPSNTITTYAVHSDGSLGAPVVNPSAGETPFGFDFTRLGTLVVSEAFGGAPDISATSQYTVNSDGSLTTTAASVPTTETAACWVEILGRYAYVTNTGSGTISGYKIYADGSLELLDADGVTATTGDGPVDMDIALRYLYVHSGGSRTLGAYQINKDGSLTELEGGVSGLPEFAVGVAAN